MNRLLTADALALALAFVPYRAVAERNPARATIEAAKKGDASAQLLLGNLYQLGQGVPKRAVTANSLYSVSATGDASPVNPAPSHRAELARKMSPAEVEDAKALSADMTKPGEFAGALDQYLKKSTKP